MSYCEECLERLTLDQEEFVPLWELAGEESLTAQEAHRALSLLFRISHARILKICGPRVAKYYPTPKRYAAALLPHKHPDLWWTFHATGGVDIKPVLVWFSGQPRPGKDGKLRPRGGSTHFAIEHDGTPWSFVRLSDGAWHCRGRNRDSVSVELVNACALRHRLSPDRESGVVKESYRWWAGDYELPYEPVHTRPWRGGTYWQPYDERQMVSLVKLMRLCSAALGDGRFARERICQHYHFHKTKVDCGPLFPQGEIVDTHFDGKPLSAHEWVHAFGDSAWPGWDEDTELGPQELEELFDHAVDLDLNPQQSALEDDEPDTPTVKIKKYQTVLADIGLYTGKVDGRVGPLTRAAVRTFQMLWNDAHPEETVAVDGIAGPITLDALSRFIKERAFS